MKTMGHHEIDVDQIHVVCVDSRGKATSDMTCYKEHVCSVEFFKDHIKDNPKNICLKSQVAALCGLDLNVFFHVHSPLHHISKEDHHIYKPMCTNVNGIATLLTFNPETGYYNHLVFGKAYVLLDDGKAPLSMQQLWGIVELITEAKNLYHQDHRHISEQAYRELLGWVTHYRAKTWVPRSIYEPRRPKKPVYFRYESGMSDQATCHHGDVHVHHDGPHKCCHTDEDDIWDTSPWDQTNTMDLSFVPAHDPCCHHVVSGPSHSSDPPAGIDCHTPAHHDRRLTPPYLATD